MQPFRSDSARSPASGGSVSPPHSTPVSSRSPVLPAADAEGTPTHHHTDHGAPASDGPPSFWSAFSWANITRSKPITMVLAEAAAQSSPLAPSSIPLRESSSAALQPLLGVDDSSSASAASACRDEEAPLSDQRRGSFKAQGLQKKLGLLDLIAMGVGCTVGAGIYSLIGPGVKVAGPALLLSFLIGAVSCVFTGLAYSEFAARIPVSGSAYTYAYTSFGELLGWIIGWNLTLEYAISAAAIARSWSDYFNQLLRSIHVDPPKWLHQWDVGGGIEGSPFAALIVIVCSAVMLFGVKESAKFTMFVTVSNVVVLLFVACLGATKVDSSNWTVVNDSYVPYGASSVFSAAGTVFFSYLGFDMVSSMAEEVHNPQKKMPIGIIGSLSISGLIYVAVTLTVTGMVSFKTIANESAPLSYAFKEVGLHWATYVINAGSVLGLTAATFTCLLGQPRIFYKMAHDGLLFPVFGRLSRRAVPMTGTVITGGVTATIAFIFGLKALSDAISIGTLFAFSIVDAGVVVLRRKDHTDSVRVMYAVCSYTACCFIACLAFHQDWGIAVSIIFGAAALALLAYMYRLPVTSVPASFACPWVPLIPCAGIAVNMSMMTALDAWAWLRLAGWTLIGVALYLGYGIHHSTLNQKQT